MFGDPKIIAKKELAVIFGKSIYNIDDWFFQAMNVGIEKNINNPSYTEVMDLDFSTSSLAQKTVNNTMLMYSCNCNVTIAKKEILFDKFH